MGRSFGYMNDFPQMNSTTSLIHTSTTYNSLSGVMWALLRFGLLLQWLTNYKKISYLHIELLLGWSRDLYPDMEILREVYVPYEAAGDLRRTGKLLKRLKGRSVSGSATMFTEISQPVSWLTKTCDHQPGKAKILSRVTQPSIYNWLTDRYRYYSPSSLVWAIHKKR